MMFPSPENVIIFLKKRGHGQKKDVNINPHFPHLFRQINSVSSLFSLLVRCETMANAVNINLGFKL